VTAQCHTDQTADIPQHLPDFDEDYKEIKNLADEQKKQKEYSKWIEELKERIYWETRI